MPAPSFRCAAVVTDIEGTTGSIAFVRDVLFPYATEQLAAFVAGRRADPEVTRLLHDAAVIAGEPEATPARVIEILRDWIVEDRKATPLKSLQGLVWAAGYESGVLRGHVYPDAVRGLRRWNADGVALYVYSSGSIAAQKLLFGYSEVGDLTPLFSGHFDTTSGAKGDVDSYRRIASAVGIPVGELLFLSDREAELDAADAAGWQVACVARPADTAPGTVSKFRSFSSFDDIEIARSAAHSAATFG